MSPRWSSDAARKAHRLRMRRGLAAGLLAMASCDAGSARPDGAAGTSAEADGAAASASHGGGAGDAESRDASTAQAGSAGRESGAGGHGEVTGGADASVAGSGGAPSVADDGVTLGALARSVLWSWTTARQVEELRNDPVLLTRSESSTGMKTNLSTVLSKMAAEGDALAQVLAGTSFAKGRYGWTNAWATVRGWPDESYGDQLLRIVLRPEALLVVAQSGRLEVLDMQNQPVDVSVALAEPERIGGVYFLSDSPTDTPSCGTFTSGCAPGAYREYFINNERMVMEWSLGTQAILDEIDRGIAVATDLRAQIAAGTLTTETECGFTQAAYCAWQFLGSRTYYEALALTSPFYEPTTANADALIAALQAARFTPDPLIHEP